MASLNHPPVSPLRKGGQIRTLFRDSRLWPMKRRSTLLRYGPATDHGGTSSTPSETGSGPPDPGRSPLIPKWVPDSARQLLPAAPQPCSSARARPAEPRQGRAACPGRDRCTCRGARAQSVASILQQSSRKWTNSGESAPVRPPHPPCHREWLRVSRKPPRPPPAAHTSPMRQRGKFQRGRLVTSLRLRPPTHPPRAPPGSRPQWLRVSRNPPQPPWLAPDFGALLPAGSWFSVA